MSEDSGGHEVQVLSTEQIIDDTTKSQPEGKWVVYKPDKSFGLTVKLPHESTANGTLSVDDNDSRHLKLDIIQVNKALQGEGTGTGSRLLQSLITEGKAYGAVDLYAHVTSIGMLKTLARVCGKDRLKLVNHNTGATLEESYNEILAKAEKESRVSCGISIDISDIDTSEWERPKIAS